MLITASGVPITEFKLPDEQRYEETTKKSVLAYTELKSPAKILQID